MDGNLDGNKDGNLDGIMDGHMDGSRDGRATDDLFARSVLAGTVQTYGGTVQNSPVQYSTLHVTVLSFHILLHDGERRQKGG